MPIYEYRCEECGHCFERIQGLADRDSKVVCPRCGKAKAERMMSTFCCGGGEKGIESGGASSSCGAGGGRFS